MRPSAVASRARPSAVAALALAVLLVTGLTAALPTTARADETPAQRVRRIRHQAASVRDRIDRANDAIADVVERFDANREALGATRRDAHRTHHRMLLAQERLARAQERLARRARAVYIFEPNPVARFSRVINANGMQAAVAVRQYEAWAVAADASAVDRIAEARRELAGLSARLAAQRRDQESLQRRLVGQRREIEERVRQLRAFLARLGAAQRRAVEQQRREAEARRRAAALRRLAAERAWRQRHPAPGDLVRGATSAQTRTAVGWGLAQLGRPYQWGATGPDRFDCSGLTMRAWQHAGVFLPRTSGEQWRAVRPLGGILAVRAGDLLFFGGGGRIHHVAIAIGGGRMLEAPYTGAKVRVSSMFRRGFVGAGRPAG